MLDPEQQNASQFVNCSALLNYTEEYNTSFHDCPRGIYSGNDKYSFSAEVCVTVCYILTFVVGLLGNTLVIYVVARWTKMQTVTNLYILNLAISDEIFLMGIPFIIATAIYSGWPFECIMCKLYFTTTALNQFTSTMFLTILSADRYMAVCQPISSNHFRTKMNSRIVSATAWAASALMGTPIIMYADTITVHGRTSCNVFMPVISGISGHKIYIYYVFILSFVLPFTLIFIFYCLVIHKLKTVGPKTKSKDKKKSHKKVTRLVLTVILVYAFCWLPFWVQQLNLLTYEPRKTHSPYKLLIFIFSTLLTYINSAMNPILYAFLSENFKKSFMKAFACLTATDRSLTIFPENSNMPQKQKEEVDRDAEGLTEGETADKRTSNLPVSRDVSSAMTLSSRAPHSHTSEEQKNGHLLEVPHISSRLMNK